MTTDLHSLLAEIMAKGEKTLAHNYRTILRIFIPAGAVINLLNLIEVTTPSGICLIVRLPLLAGADKHRILSIDTIKDAIEKAGGTVEFVD